MGMDLYNTESRKSVSYNRITWTFLLYAAQDYGWEPAGTVMPGHDDWPGSYGTNEQQMVTASDASALAAALERCLQDPAEAMQSHERKFMEELTAFAKEGSFLIC